MKPMMATAMALVLEQLRYQERNLYTGARLSLPRSKKFTGARKIQRAAKKRRNARRGRP